ncbi:MAG: hypothetical protein WCJ64_22500 [Rhodospirillaceae bacterium]
MRRGVDETMRASGQGLFETLASIKDMVETRNVLTGTMLIKEIATTRLNQIIKRSMGSFRHRHRWPSLYIDFGETKNRTPKKRKKLAVFLLSLLVLGTAGALLDGCSTVHGMGDDLQSGSNTVRKSM